MLDCSTMATPTSAKDSPTTNDLQHVNPTEYHTLVGSLQYLTFTRSVITHVVNRACQHLQQLAKTNCMAVKQILHNLKGTLNYGIQLLDQRSISLYAFLNSDWIGCPITRRSTTSFCVYLSTNCISWYSKKQGTIAYSSVEAEYHSMAVVGVELT